MTQQDVTFVASDHVGDIKSVSEFEGGPGWYQCKGHVLKADFVRALMEQWAVLVPEDKVEHLWIHYTPIRDGDHWQVIGNEYRKPGRGRTPRTSVEVRWCKEMKP